MHPTSFNDRRDRGLFPAAYDDPESGVSTNRGAPSMRVPVCVDKPIYTGHAAIAADIAHFKAGLQAAGVEEGFMTSSAPGSCSRIGNEYYKTEEEFNYACADAMREEYKAIIDAGLVLQLDDPSIAENWDMVNPAPTVEEYRVSPISRWQISSTSCWRSTRRPTRSKQAMSAMSTNGASGGTVSCPTARYRSRAWLATPPT